MKVIVKINKKSEPSDLRAGLSTHFRDVRGEKCVINESHITGSSIKKEMDDRDIRPR